mgnify:CR=1 FL=1
MTLIKALKTTYPNWLGYSLIDEKTKKQVNNLAKRKIVSKRILKGHGYIFASVKLKRKYEFKRS